MVDFSPGSAAHPSSSSASFTSCSEWIAVLEDLLLDGELAHPSTVEALPDPLSFEEFCSIGGGQPECVEYSARASIASAKLDKTIHPWHRNLPQHPGGCPRAARSEIWRPPKAKLLNKGRFQDAMNAS